MSAGLYCNREVVVVHPEMSVLLAAKLMREHHVGTVVIVLEENGHTHPLGIVTDRDLVVSVMAKDLVPEEVTVGDLCIEELAVVGEDDDLWDTLDQMKQQGIRRMPVVNTDGGLEGILTLDDILELVAGALSSMVSIVNYGILKEKKQRT